MIVKMRGTTIFGGLLAASGVAVIAYDAGVILEIIFGDGLRTEQRLTTIGELWAAVEPGYVLAHRYYLVSHVASPVAKSIVEIITGLPIAPILIFAGTLLSLSVFMRKKTDSKGALAQDTATSKSDAVGQMPGTGEDSIKSKAPVIVARRKTNAANREFLPAALEIIETPSSPIIVALLWFICLAFTSALTWSYFGHLDIYAIASGKIQPSGRSKVVQPFEAGKVVAVHVENGSRVDAGDVLIDLDPTETSADRELQSRELETTSAEVVRRRTAVAIARSAALVNRPVPYEIATSETVRKREDGMLAADIAQLASARDSLKAQLSEIIAKRQRINMTIDARLRLIKILKERVDTRGALDAQGQGYRSKVIDALQEYEREQTNLAGDQGQVVELDANKQSIELKIEETFALFIREQTDRLTEAERKKDRLAQELIKAKTKNDRTRLTAPIAGVVQQLAVTTLGQVVAAGQSLMTVVPQDAPVEIEAMILNPDIGFVEVGQSVTIKVDAFPFTRYGTLEGSVANISRDGVDRKTSANLSDAANVAKPQAGAAPSSSATTAEALAFPAKISISRQTMLVDGKVVSLLPGMSVTVEVKTGQRRAIDYLLSPLSEVRAAALQER